MPGSAMQRPVWLQGGECRVAGVHVFSHRIRGHGRRTLAFILRVTGMGTGERPDPIDLLKSSLWLL